jgi:hypothetical protein
MTIAESADVVVDADGVVECDPLEATRSSTDSR